MTESEDDLIRAIESSLQVYPPVSGLSEDLAVKGVRGRVHRSVASARESRRDG
jgi:hypothetical protein